MDLAAESVAVTKRLAGVAGGGGGGGVRGVVGGRARGSASGGGGWRGRARGPGAGGAAAARRLRARLRRALPPRRGRQAAALGAAGLAARRSVPTRAFPLFLINTILRYRFSLTTFYHFILRPVYDGAFHI